MKTLIAWCFVAVLGACAESPANSSTNGVTTDGSVACGETVAAACGGQLPCVTAWPSDPASEFCKQFGPAGVRVNASCSQYEVFEARGTDRAALYYYDSGSEALTAIVLFDANAMTRGCLAGPEDFVEPQCATSQISCWEAGAVGGSTANGGSDGGGTAGAGGAR